MLKSSSCVLPVRWRWRSSSGAHLLLRGRGVEAIQRPKPPAIRPPAALGLIAGPSTCGQSDRDQDQVVLVLAIQNSGPFSPAGQSPEQQHFLDADGLPNRIGVGE